MKIMLLGYIRPDPRHPESSQRKVLEAFGVSKFYVEGDRKRDAGYPELEKLTRAVRKSASDELVLSDFHRLSSNGDDLKENMRKVRKAGLVVVEASTGRRSDCQADLLDMTVETKETWANRGMTPTAAKENGAKGGASAALTNRKEAPLPMLKIQQIMDDHVTYPTVLDAITEINRGKRGRARVSLNTIYRWNREGKFKPPLRPRPAGPISNRKS
jgi:hypothetical protein